MPLILIAGWWFVRNGRLYGDPLAWEMWEANILLRVIPAGPAQIVSELEGWSVPFGAVRLAESALSGVAVPGAACRRHLRHGWAVGYVVRYARRVGRAKTMPYAILLLWLLVLTISWLRFMRVAPAAQGRYFFAALPALGLLWALGWAGWDRFGLRIGLRVTYALGLLTWLHLLP